MTLTSLTLGQGHSKSNRLIGPWILSTHSMKFHFVLISSFWAILLTNEQTDRQTDTGEDTTSLANVIIAEDNKINCSVMQLSSVRVITITLVIKSVSQKANRNNIVQWAIKLVIGDSELVIGKMTLRKWAVSFIRVEDLECNSFVVGESGLGVGRRWRRQDADQYCPWKHCGRDGLRDRLVKWDPPPSSTGLWGELEPTKTFHSSAVVITQTLKKKIKWNPAVWSERAYGICIRLCRSAATRQRRIGWDTQYAHGHTNTPATITS